MKRQKFLFELEKLKEARVSNEKQNLCLRLIVTSWGIEHSDELEKIHYFESRLSSPVLRLLSSWENHDSTGIRTTKLMRILNMGTFAT